MLRLTTVAILTAAVLAAVLPAVPAAAYCGGAYPDDGPLAAEMACAVEQALCRLTQPPSACIPPP